MGMIIIETRGSLGTRKEEFSCLHHGHAHAVNEAIKYLTERMTHAVNLDHKLHDGESQPDSGFQKGSTE